MKIENHPKHRQIYDVILTRIESGELKEGDKLPSEQDMAREFGVAYMTMRTAVNALAGKGWVRRVQGKGTFVAVPQNSRGTTLLAMIVPSLQQLWSVSSLYYFPSILQGFCAEATRLGYEPVVLGRSKDQFQPGSGELEQMAGAACLLTAPEDFEVVEGLRDLGVPVVGINAYAGRRTIPFVAAEQTAGARRAVRYLAEKGHLRIAFLPGPANNLGAEERLRGFREEMAELKLKPYPMSNNGRDYTDAGGYIRTQALLAFRQPPTAILAAGDLIAAGVLQAVREAGLSVPDDVSVMGFGDFEIVRHVQPQLTTMHLPLTELGSHAAALLARHTRGEGNLQNILLLTELVERDSVAPPRKA
ncbi:MAG: LacI family transcriptional regulator [Abditibacteriota bacterium]|nr:LacI family transcriptional regulator [Abditibacteriota bacterium]